MLKNAYLLKKISVKIASASGAPEPPFASGGWGSAPDPRVVTPAFYYNFVEFVSIAKYVLLP